MRRVANATIDTKTEVGYHTDVTVSTPDLVSLFRDGSAWLDRFWLVASRPHSSIPWFQGEMTLLCTSTVRILVAELHINQYPLLDSPISSYLPARPPSLLTLQRWHPLNTMLIWFRKWRNQSSCSSRRWWKSNLGTRNGTVSRSTKLSKTASGEVVEATDFGRTSSLWQHRVIGKLLGWSSWVFMLR